MIFAASTLWLTGLHEYLSFDRLKLARDVLRSHVEDNYMASVGVYVAVVVSTAFFVPGAIAITLVGGFLFGVTMGTAYLVSGATAGASLAFLSSRYIIGGWVQHRYGEQLSGFNREVSRHGHRYLIFFRIVPIMPFFLVNFLAGITRIPLWRFTWSTALGMLPGSVVYCFAGKELGAIDSPHDIMSPSLMLALLLLALFALLPVFSRVLKKRPKLLF